MKLKWTYKIYDKKWNLLNTIDNAIQWTAKSFIQGYYMGNKRHNYNPPSYWWYMHHWLLYSTQLYLWTDNTTATEWDCDPISDTWTNMNTVFAQAQWPYTPTARQWDYVSQKASNTYSIPSSAQWTYNEIGIVSKPFTNNVDFITFDWVWTNHRVWVSRANWPIIIPDWWAIIVYEIEVDSFTFANGRQAMSVSNTLTFSRQNPNFWGRALQWQWDFFLWGSWDSTWFGDRAFLWTSDVAKNITDNTMGSLVGTTWLSQSLITHRSNWSKNILVRDMTYIFSNVPIWTYKEFWLWYDYSTTYNTYTWLRQIKDRVVTSATNQVTVNFRLLLD